jgi:hypothetical protein
MGFMDLLRADAARLLALRLFDGLEGAVVVGVASGAAAVEPSPDWYWVQLFVHAPVYVPSGWQESSHVYCIGTALPSEYFRQVMD